SSDRSQNEQRSEAAASVATPASTEAEIGSERQSPSAEVGPATTNAPDGKGRNTALMRVLQQIVVISCSVLRPWGTIGAVFESTRMFQVLAALAFGLVVGPREYGVGLPPFPALLITEAAIVTGGWVLHRGNRTYSGEQVSL
ncbi:unnamed protein product, partial [Ostreobium quekettii]